MALLWELKLIQQPYSHGEIIFIVIGAFTAFMGTLFLYFMPDNQLNARFLTQEERVMAVERIRINQQGIGNKHWKFYQFKEAFADPMVWGVVFFSLVLTVPTGKSKFPCRIHCHLTKADTETKVEFLISSRSLSYPLVTPVSNLCCLTPLVAC